MSYPVNTGRPMDMGVHRMNSLDNRMGSPHGGLHSSPLIVVDKKPKYAGCTFSLSADSRRQDWQFAKQEIWPQAQDELRKLAKRQFQSTASGRLKDVTDEIKFRNLPLTAQHRIEDWINDKKDLENEPNLYTWDLVTIREKNKIGGLINTGKKSLEVIIKRILRSAAQAAVESHERRTSRSSGGLRRIHSTDDILGGGSRRRRGSFDISRGGRGSLDGRGGLDDLGIGRRDSFGGGRRSFDDFDGPNMRPQIGGMYGRGGLNAPRGGLPPLGGMNGGMNGGILKCGMNGGMNGGGFTKGPMGGMNGGPIGGMSGGPMGGIPGGPMGGMKGANVQIVDSDSDSDDDFQPNRPMNGPRPGGGMAPMGGTGMGQGPMGAMQNNMMPPPPPPMNHNMPPLDGPGNMNNMNAPRGMGGVPGMGHQSMGGMPNMNSGGPMGNMGPMNGMGGQPPRMNPNGVHGMQGGMGMPRAPQPPHIVIPMNGGHHGGRRSHGNKRRPMVHQGYSDDDSDALTSAGSDFSTITPNTSSSLGEEVPHRSGHKYRDSTERAYRQHGRRRRSSTHHRRGSDDFIFVESRRPRLIRGATSPSRGKFYERDHCDKLDRIEAEIRDAEIRNRARQVDEKLKLLTEREQRAAIEELDRKMRRLQIREREERYLEFPRSPRSPGGGRVYRDEFRERDVLRDFGRHISPIDDDRRTIFSSSDRGPYARRRDESRYGDRDLDRYPARRF